MATLCSSNGYLCGQQKEMERHHETVIGSNCGSGHLFRDGCRGGKPQIWTRAFRRCVQGNQLPSWPRQENPPCVPPGQARKYNRGDVIYGDYTIIGDPGQYGLNRY